MKGFLFNYFIYFGYFKGTEIAASKNIQEKTKKDKIFIERQSEQEGCIDDCQYPNEGYISQNYFIYNTPFIWFPYQHLRFRLNPGRNNHRAFHFSSNPNYDSLREHTSTDLYSSLPFLPFYTIQYSAIRLKQTSTLNKKIRKLNKEYSEPKSNIDLPILEKSVLIERMILFLENERSRYKLSSISDNHRLLCSSIADSFEDSQPAGVALFVYICFLTKGFARFRKCCKVAPSSILNSSRWYRTFDMRHVECTIVNWRTFGINFTNIRSGFFEILSIHYKLNPKWVLTSEHNLDLLLRVNVLCGLKRIFFGI